MNPTKNPFAFAPGFDEYRVVRGKENEYIPAMATAIAPLTLLPSGPLILGEAGAITPLDYFHQQVVPIIQPSLNLMVEGFGIDESDVIKALEPIWLARYALTFNDYSALQPKDGESTETSAAWAFDRIVMGKEGGEVLPPRFHGVCPYQSRDVAMAVSQWTDQLINNQEGRQHDE